MRRRSETHLLTWLESTRRKPLIVRGARQVGKTWLVRNLARTADRVLVELNFEREPRLRELFRHNDPARVLRELEQYFGQAIEPQRSLLFLDEIQAAPDLLAKLRWFAEDLPALPVVAAGSLLDFALHEHDFSMPVGRIGYHHLEPMSFEEFLGAMGEEPLVAALSQLGPTEQPSDLVHDKLLDLFGQYRLVGGMPAAVDAYRDTRSQLEVERLQQDLLATFRDDFHKYTGRIAHERLDAVLRQIPAQVGCKFKYSHVDPDVPSASLKRALQLLTMARLCHRVQATAANAVPLAAEARDRMFKVILLDTGLLATLLGIAGRAPRPTHMRTLEGALSEQVVGQLLRSIEPSHREPRLYYWQRDKRGSEAEVDYVLADGGRVVPLEVKAGKTGTLRSLHAFVRTKGHRLAVRINADLPTLTDVDVGTRDGQRVTYALLSLPFYLVEQLPRLLDQVSEHQ